MISTRPKPLRIAGILLVFTVGLTFWLTRLNETEHRFLGVWTMTHHGTHSSRMVVRFDSDGQVQLRDAKSGQFANHDNLTWSAKDDRLVLVEAENATRRLWKWLRSLAAGQIRTVPSAYYKVDWDSPDRCCWTIQHAHLTSAVSVTCERGDQLNTAE